MTAFLKRVVCEYKMLIEKMGSKIQDIYDLLERNNLLETYTAKKEAILATYETLKPYFDEIYSKKSIRTAVKHGHTNLSNYVLYNFKDKPVELYKRLRLNVDLCEELGVSIYSFSMKYRKNLRRTAHQERSSLRMKIDEL